MPYVLGSKNNSKTPDSGSSNGRLVLGSQKPKDDTFSRKPINGPVEMDDVTGTLGRSERLANERQQEIEKTRSIPVIGKVLKGLDAAGEFIEKNPVTHFITQTGRDIMSSGPAGAISGLEGAATNIIGKYAPKLIVGSTIGSKAAGAAAREALVGAPLGAAQTQAANPEASISDVLKGAAIGAGGGAVLGGLGTAGVSGLTRFADLQANKLTQNAIRNAAENTRSPVSSPFVLGATDNAIARGYTENVGKTFGNSTPSRINDVVPRQIPTGAAGSVSPRVSPQVIEPIAIPEIPQPRTSSPTQSTPAQQGIRANYGTQLDDGSFSPELQSAIRNTDQRYDVQTNRASVNAANEAIKDLPTAENKFLLNEAGGAEHIATGYRLMQELDALGEHARALKVADKLAADLTKSGQTSQAASILARLSPEGQLLNLVRTAEKNGKEVTVADSVKFKELASKVQERSGAGIRANQFNAILDRLERGENVGVDDIKKLSDFLSGAEKIAKPKVIKIVEDIPAELKQPRKREKIVSFLEEAEQAALARISARKNNLNSLPINEWADHGIVVASQIAKGLIKASTHVEDLVRMFGEEIRPYASEVFQNAQRLLKQSSSHLGSDDIEKANQALRRVTGEKQPLPEKIVEKYVRENENISKKDIEKLRELAKKVTALSGDQKVEADIAMQNILNSYEKSSVLDKVNAIRYIAMLLNSGTQAINAISGPIMASTGSLADILGSMIRPSSTTLYGTNPLRFMAGYLKNLKVGAKAGFQGANPAGIQGTNEIRGLTYKGKYNPLSWAERGLGAVAKGADYATYKTVFDSEIVKQGRLDARKQGIKGSDAIKSHIERYVNDPPEEAILQADRIGKNTTFQRSDTLGGRTANFLNSSPNALKPAVSAVFPFVRTPVNIASTAVTLTPAGIIKGIVQLANPASKATEREAIRNITLGLTGSGLGALGYYLNKIGIITDANDSGDKDVDAIKEQAGQGKYRFNTSALKRYLSAMLEGEGPEAAEKAAQYRKGDSAFDYNKLQPLAFPAAIGASLSENKKLPTGEKLGAAGESAFGSLFGMSTLKGVQDVFQPQFGGTIGEKALGTPMRIAESFFKSFSPSAIAQEARRQDPTVRKVPYNEGFVKDVGGYFKSRLPFGVSESLPPAKTTLGITKQNAPGLLGQYVNPYKSEVAPYTEAAKYISDLIDRTGDNSLAPSAPDKKVTGKDRQGKPVTVAIPQERYAQLQEEVGNEIIKRVKALSPTLSDARKAEKLKEIYSDAKEKYRTKVKKELGVR